LKRRRVPDGVSSIAGREWKSSRGKLLPCREINAGLADAKIKAGLADLGGIPLAGSPADFGKLIADKTEKWGKVIKFAGIKGE
jgi:hypothetical protein